MKRPVLIIEDAILFPESELRMETDRQDQVRTLNIVDQETPHEVIVATPLHTVDTLDITELPSMAISPPIL